MRRRLIMTTGGIAAMSAALLITSAGLAETSDVEPPNRTLTGVLHTGTEADGDRTYLVGDTRVDVGPLWFWGAGNPLAGHVGSSVSVTGHVDLGEPAAKNKTKKTSDGPEFEVYKVDGKTVRTQGKPPWAGGPKVVGARHPGH